MEVYLSFPVRCILPKGFCTQQIQLNKGFYLDILNVLFIWIGLLQHKMYHLIYLFKKKNFKELILFLYYMF